MKNLMIKTASILAIFSASQAFAQDFDGAYLGAQVSMTDSSVTLPIAPFSQEGEGTQVGAFAGYNYQFSNNFVLGGEIAYSGGKVQHTVTNPALDLYTQNYSDAKLKAGYVIDPQVMVYATGGLSIATGEVGPIGTTSTFALGGRNYGVGLDYKATNNMTFGFEVLKREMDSIPGAVLDYDTLSYSLRTAFLF